MIKILRMMTGSVVAAIIGAHLNIMGWEGLVYGLGFGAFIMTFE